MLLKQRCPTLKKHSSQMWRQELLCRHICCTCILAKIDSFFYLSIFSLGPHNEKVSIIIICQIVLVTYIFVQNLKKGKNMKFKKLCLSPHLNCQSPHEAIGDKVGHRCSKSSPSSYRLPKTISFCCF